MVFFMHKNWMSITSFRCINLKIYGIWFDALSITTIRNKYRIFSWLLKTHNRLQYVVSMDRPHKQFRFQKSFYKFKRCWNLATHWISGHCICNAMHHGGVHNANNTIFIQAIGKLINECQMAAGVFFCPILDMPANKKHSQAFSMYKMTFHFLFFLKRIQCSFVQY